MEPTKDTKLGGLQSPLSRRNLLKGAAAAYCRRECAKSFWSTANRRPSQNGLALHRHLHGCARTRGRNGQGIYLCELNLFTGELTVLRLVAPALPATGTTPSTASPSTIALDPAGTYLYAGNEYGPPGAVSAYAINRHTGDLTLLNVQPAAGRSGSCQRRPRWQVSFLGRILGSWFEVFPILPNGSLGPAVFQVQTLGNVDTSFRTKPATNAPPGSFAFSAHEGPNGHPHQMEADPSNQWVLGSDAGQDRIYVWKLSLGGTPPLTPAATPFVNTPPGDGPRHFAFHPNGVWMYSIQEEASTIMFWRFDRATGVLSPQQIIPSVPPGFTGTNFTSEIRVSADGDFVYGANRLNDTISVFKIGRDGTPHSNKPRFNDGGLSKNIHHRSLRTVHGGW